ncbi:MAG: hypothetical protein EPN93_17235 [Spirochaetes bacterium]|nr:MAG: hypothetical protein EPN93_17235 [Spirochaetota bacterium]
MVKKVLVLSVLALFVVAGCGKADKYADAKSLIGDMTKLYEGFIGGVEKAGSGKDLAAAINKFADGMKPLAVKAKDLEKKNPELKFKDPKNPPKELEAEFKKFEDLTKKFMSQTVMEKMMKYATDPEVQKAQKDMTEKLKDL